MSQLDQKNLRAAAKPTTAPTLILVGAELVVIPATRPS